MLMDRLGMKYEVASPSCGEDLAPGTHPREGTLALAERKARSVADAFASSLIIGSDQMAWLGGERLDKPGTFERAVEQLTRMQGRTHELWTAVALLDTREGGGLVSHVQRWTLTMRPLTREQAARYVRADDPLDCAGSYRFESRGMALFESAIGDDPTAISGLPMLALIGMLERAGAQVV